MYLKLVNEAYLVIELYKIITMQIKYFSVKLVCIDFNIVFL